jgi:hypothetical protein
MGTKGKSKYRWEDIRADWEVGRSYRYLSGKYKVPMNTVKTRAYKYKWKRDNAIIEAAKELEATTVALKTVTQDATNPAKRDAVQLLITEVVSRAELIASNRVLVRQAQMVLAHGFANEDIAVGDLKDVTHAIKNMNDIVDPNSRSPAPPGGNAPVIIDIPKSEVKKQLRNDGIPEDLLEFLDE